MHQGKAISKCARFWFKQDAIWLIKTQHINWRATTLKSIVKMKSSNISLMNINHLRTKRRFKVIVGKKAILKIKWSLRLKRKDKLMLLIKQPSRCFVFIGLILSEILIRSPRHNMSNYWVIIHNCNKCLEILMKSIWQPCSRWRRKMLG